MKARLMDRHRDFDLSRPLPPNAEALTQDLELDTLFRAMSGGDEFLFQVARAALLGAMWEDLETVLYRQAVLGDCLRNASVVHDIYEIAVEAIEGKKKSWFGIFGHSPASILHGSVELARLFIGMLRKLRQLADEHSSQFASEGFTAFFAMLQAELTDDYFAVIEEHLKALAFRGGVLVSAELGPGGRGANYVLRKPSGKRPGWIEHLFTRQPAAFTFCIAERDEAGARALSELQNRGLNRVANALAQAVDQIQGFFVMLQTELAFYIGGIRLHGLLGQKGAVSFPVPLPPGERGHSFSNLRDACLALRLDEAVVGNDLEAGGKSLIVITGANQGGKSTFLRAVGLAQIMMQCGLFVAADAFRTDLRGSLFTHYKREEDTTLQSGKFDEELSRMNGIVDALTPRAMLLFNESFAATYEREGSEIARQIVRALLEKGVKIFFVTHLYEFSGRLYRERPDDALFLRAERRADGRRTFRLTPGEPLQTGFGADLYREIFGGMDGGMNGSGGGEGIKPPPGPPPP